MTFMRDLRKKKLSLSLK